jgi:pyrroloquinoline quinone biosynthesis protein B
VIVRVLGSAAGGGVPQWNCGCNNCAAARRGEAPIRTQSSIAFSPDGRTWLLINASADLPQQLARTTALWPRAIRENPFCAVLLTDANVDHTAGLGELRQNPGPLVIVSSKTTRELLEGERAFERFARSPHRWVTPEEGSDAVAEMIDASLAQHLHIEMIDVPGLLPGYAGRKVARGAVVAYVIRERASGAQVTIAPVFMDFNDRLYDCVAASDVALLDGTFFTDGELQDRGLPAKRARALGHAPIGGADGTLVRVAALRNRRVFVHVNNTNPILDPHSDERKSLADAGCEVSHDGWHWETSFTQERDRGDAQHQRSERAEA